jgi:ribosome-associated protein
VTPADGALEITSNLHIPWRELSFHASRAGGAGGQHVNKTASRVELRWNVAESPSLTPEQRSLLLQRLARRLDKTGRIRVVSDERRSQSQNREAATERFVRLLAGALQVARPRKKTRPTRASVEKRIQAKKLRATRKEGRRPIRDDE